MSELLSQRITLNSVVPILSLHVSRYTPQPPHSSAGGKSQRGWQGKHRDRRKRILRNRNVHGVSSSPASRRDGCVPPVHSVRIRSSPILSRDVPGRWNGEDSRSPGCIHGRHSLRVLPWEWRLRSHSRRSLHPPDFPEGPGLREASSRSYNVQTRRCRCRR